MTGASLLRLVQHQLLRTIWDVGTSLVRAAIVGALVALSVS
jgi:hypothetical protein